MAVLELFTEHFAAALAAYEVTVITEYQRQGKPLPPEKEFVCVGLHEMLCGTPLRSGDGLALPAELTLRVQMLCTTDRNVRCLQELFETALIPALADSGIAVKRLAFGAVKHDAKSDRFVRECLITVPALLTRMPSGDST